MPVTKKSELANGHGSTAVLAPDAKRMILSAIRKSEKSETEKVVLYAPEGWGKTTWAAQAPDAVFLSAEDGLKSVTVDVFPEPHKWEEVLDCVESLRAGDHGYQTLVVDSADWIEALCHAYILRTSGKNSITEVGGGFGKGFVVAFEEFKRIIQVIDHLRREKKMNIVFLAHSTVKTFNNPQGDNFERWELKLDTRVSALLKEWADDVLFGTYDIAVDKEKGQKGKGYGGERIIHTSHTAAYDAKNRNNLPDPMAVSAAEFWNIVKGGEKS